MGICKRLNAYNSAAYSKCVVWTALNPVSTCDEVRQVLREYDAKSGLSPYYDIERISEKHNGNLMQVVTAPKTHVVHRIRIIDRY